MAKRQEQEPNWQPITALPMLSRHIETGLAGAREQLALLERARPKPYVLDQPTIARVKRVSSETAEDMELFARQAEVWRAGTLTDAQRRGVDAYATLVEQMRESTAAVLALADELADGTIETVLAKSDAELGLEALTRRHA
jgi:hypothetical protein